MTSKNLLAGGGLLLGLVLLGTADALVTERFIMLPESDAEEVKPVANEQGVAPAQQESGGGVRKLSGPNIEEILASLSLVSATTEQMSIIRRVIPEQIPVTTIVVLKDGDRVGFLSSTESPQVKTFFLALKEALHTSFTPDMRELVDETQQRPRHPVRNFLTFFDPGIDTERLVFVRVRERLYEFHIAEEKDAEMFELIEALTN